MQQFAGRATIDIGARIVAEVLAGETALLLKPSVALVYRHIGSDAIILASLQVFAIVVGFVGQHLQRLDTQSIFDRFGHHMEMACIAAIDDLASDDQHMLVVDDALHVVTRNGLVALAQKPCIGIGLGHLPLVAGLKLLEVGLRALTPGHQLLHLLADIAATALAAILRTAARTLGLFRIVGVERLAVSIDLPIQFGDLLGQLPFLALPWNSAPSTATRVLPIRSSSRISSRKLRFAALKAAQFSLRKLAIVR